MQNKILFNTILLFFFIFIVSILKAQEPFVTLWVPIDSNIKIRTYHDGIPAWDEFTYNYEINWMNLNGSENGSASGLSKDYNITGLTPGDTIRVEIGGVFPGIYHPFGFDAFPGYRELIEISQWGDIQWQSLHRAFSQCINLEMTATDTPDLSGVIDMSYAFAQCSSLKANPSINNWDVSHIYNMTGLFIGAELFNQNISNWDVSKVGIMQIMFAGDTAFNQPLSNWNVSKVTDMGGMFSGAGSFNQSIGNWDVSMVKKMARMFRDAVSFNQDIGDWNVSHVTDMSALFRGAAVFNQDIGNWDVSEVTTMYAMFEDANSFNQDIGDWDVSSVTIMKRMFMGAKVFNQDLSRWNLTSLGNHIFGYSAEKMFNAQAGQGMSCENFGRTLLGWANNPNTPDSITLGALNRKYPSDIQDEIDHFVNDLSWTINGLSGTCEPLAVVDPYSQETLHVYPNPSTGQLTIKSGSQGKYSIYNIYGQLVKIGKLNAHQATRINLSDVANGIYFIRVRNRVEKIVLH